MIEEVVTKSTPKPVSILTALEVRLSLHYQTKSDETTASPQFTVSSFPKRSPPALCFCQHHALHLCGKSRFVPTVIK
jgi:hypothetical protein